MKLFALTLFMSQVVLATSTVPEPVVTTMNSHNGYATIAGRLSTKAELPVGISVRNGNLLYSTLTDSEGRWGIVIRHQAVNVQVRSWEIKTGRKGASWTSSHLEYDNN